MFTRGVYQFDGMDGPWDLGTTVPRDGSSIKVYMFQYVLYIVKPCNIIYIYININNKNKIIIIIFLLYKNII